MTDEEKKPDEVSAEETQQDTELIDVAADSQARVDEAEREREQFKTIAARAQADLVNYRRRAEEEKDEIRRNAKSSLLFKILSTVDDLHRALDMIPEDESPAWVEGIELVQRNISSVLDSEGVTKLDTLGKPYNPEHAEALQFQETADADDGSVIEVYREGYMYRDRVLRAAQVIVAKRPEQQEATELNNDKETE